MRQLGKSKFKNYLKTIPDFIHYFNSLFNLKIYYKIVSNFKLVTLKRFKKRYQLA